MNKLFGRKLDYGDWMFVPLYVLTAWNAWKGHYLLAFFASLGAGTLLGLVLRFIALKYPQSTKSSPYYLPILIVVIIIVIAAFVRM